MWESHTDRELSSDDGQDLDFPLESNDPRKLGCLQTGMQELLVGSGRDLRVPVSGVGVSSRNVETPRRAGDEHGQLASWQAISSLVTRRASWWRRFLQRGRWVDYQPGRRCVSRVDDRDMR